MTTVSEISPTQLNILPSTHTGQRSRQVVISTTRRNHTSSRVNCPTLKRGDHTHLHMYKPIYCHSTHIVQHSYGYLAAIIFRCSLSLSPFPFLPALRLTRSQQKCIWSLVTCTCHTASWGEFDFLVPRSSSRRTSVWSGWTWIGSWGSSGDLYRRGPWLEQLATSYLGRLKC